MGSRRGELSIGVYEAAERRRLLWMTVAAFGASILLGQAVIRIGPAAVAIPIALLVLAGVFWRPKIGLFALLAANLIFEESSPDPLMLPGRYLHFGLQSTLGLSGFIASPLELLMIMMVVIWLIPSMIRGSVN